MDNCPKRCQCGETESLSRSHDGTVAHFGCERRCVVQGDEWVWESASATCLRKQLARLEAEVKRLWTWQPMDSAPRDGAEVLLRVKRRAGIPGKCLVGHYMPGGHCISDHPPIDEGWYFWTGGMFDLASKPIAWMPIPEAAEAAAFHPGDCCRCALQRRANGIPLRDNEITSPNCPQCGYWRDANAEAKGGE